MVMILRMVIMMMMTAMMVMMMAMMTNDGTLYINDDEFEDGAGLEINFFAEETAGD